MKRGRKTLAEHLDKDIADPIVEKEIWKQLKKPGGELTETDLDKVAKN